MNHNSEGSHPWARLRETALIPSVAIYYIVERCFVMWSLLRGEFGSRTQAVGIARGLITRPSPFLWKAGTITTAAIQLSLLSLWKIDLNSTTRCTQGDQRFCDWAAGTEHDVPNTDKLAARYRLLVFKDKYKSYKNVCRGDSAASTSATMRGINHWLATRNFWDYHWLQWRFFREKEPGFI